MEIRGKLCNQTAVSQVRRADGADFTHQSQGDRGRRWSGGGDVDSTPSSWQQGRRIQCDDQELNFQYINILQVS